jgi:hypothetical protein
LGSFGAEHPAVAPGLAPVCRAAAAGGLASFGADHVSFEAAPRAPSFVETRRENGFVRAG